MQLIIDALATKGFAPIWTLELSEVERFDAARFQFVGWKPYWGSMLTVAVHEADRVGSDGASRVLEELFTFTNSVRQYAGSVKFARLGSFGVLIHVFRAGCDPALRSEVVSQKRGGAWRKNYCLSWVVDLQGKRAYRHRGLPLFMHPGHKWIGEVVNHGGGAV